MDQETLATRTTVPLPEPVRVALPTGIALAVARVGHPAGPPLVLLHGYSDSSVSYAPIMPLLADRYDLHALELRGHGRSDRPDTGYTVDDLAGDVLAYLDQAGLARVCLVGHSMGTLVARRVAELQPDRVSALVLMGAVGVAVGPAVHELRAAVAELGDVVPREFVTEFQVSTASVPLHPELLAAVVAESLRVPIHVWRAAADGMAVADDGDALSRITARVLLVWGEEDAFFPRSEQDDLVARIPDARLVVLPRTGHAVHWERPDDVAGHLVAFLDG